MENLLKRFIWGMPLLLFLGVCTSSYSYISVLTKIASATEQSYQVITMMPLSYAIVTASVSLFIGVLSDKWGRKNTILLSLFVSFVACIVLLFTKDLVWLIIFAGIQGSATASLAVILRLILKDTLNKDQQLFVNGYLLIGVTVAPVLAPIMGAYLVHFTNTYKGAFFLTLFTCGVSIIMTYLLIPHDQSAKQEKKIFNHIFQGLYSLLKHQRIVSLMLMVVLSFCALNILILNTPYIFENTFNITSAHASLFFIVLGLGYFVGVPITNQLKKMGFSFDKIIKVGLFFMVTSLILFLLLLLDKNNMVLFIISLVVLSTLFRIGQAIFLSASLVQVMHEIHAYDSLSAGLSCTLIYVGAFIGIGISSFFTGTHMNGMVLTLVMVGIMLYLIFLMLKSEK